MLPFTMKMMKTLMLFVFLAAVAPGQGQIPPGAPDPVVATLNGRDYRKSELELLVRSLGGAPASNFYANKRAFLEQYALTLKLEQLADERKLADQEPYKSRLAYNRTILLATAMMSANQRELKILPEDEQAYYSVHKADFMQAQTKLIYLPFVPAGTPGKSEEEVKNIAAAIVKQARAGTPFTDLVAKHSEDPDSKAKGGDFPPFKPTDNTLPAPVRTVIFALKPGEVSDPILQGNGYYIFRLEKFVEPEYSTIRSDIFLAVQKERFDKWMEGVRKSVSVEIKDQQYISETGQPKR